MTVAPMTRTRGRPPSATRADVARIALELFHGNGFDETTMGEVAREVGISRRTLFRYFPSKNDMVWGEFGEVLSRLRTDLEALPEDMPLLEALRHAAVSSNTYPTEILTELRIRITLITTTPALQAHSMLRYAEWREVVAEFAGRRLQMDARAFVPQAIGHAALAASTSAFTHWVQQPGSDLVALIDASYALLAEGFSAPAISALNPALRPPQ